MTPTSKHPESAGYRPRRDRPGEYFYMPPVDRTRDAVLQDERDRNPPIIRRTRQAAGGAKR